MVTNGKWARAGVVADSERVRGRVYIKACAEGITVFCWKAFSYL